MIDYRIQDPKIRRDYFDQYFNWSLRFYDCDSALFLLNYIHTRMELNIEQRYWVAWLYGNTYQLATAWVIANEFPDFENVDLDRLTKWNSENYKRLRYQSDQKWQKGHLPKMFESYRAAIAPYGTQQKFFEEICKSENPEENFASLYSFTKNNFHKFGRYSSWFYLQTLKETCGLNISPKNLILHEDNTHTQRAGLCYILGKDEMAADKKLYRNTEMVNEMNALADEIVKSFNALYPNLKCDMFLLETCLCAFKKTFRKKKGRYLGYYLDRQYEDIAQVQLDGWAGIDWNLLWDGRREILDPRTIRNTGVSAKDMEYFLDTGQIKYIDYLTPNKPNTMKKLFFTIGTNCSGKSSIAKQFMANEPVTDSIPFPEYKSAINVCKEQNIMIVGNYSKTGTSGGCDTIRKKAHTQDMLQRVWERPEDIFMEGYIIGSTVWLADIIKLNETGTPRELIFVTLNTELETCFKRIEGRSGKKREQLKGNGANVVSGHTHSKKMNLCVTANRPEFKTVILDAEHLTSAELCLQLLTPNAL